MRPVRLVRIAAEAEGVRLRGLISRIATRVLLAVMALIFLLGALAFGHVALWYWLRTAMNQPLLAATGIVGGADLVVALILGFLASRSTPSRVEVEALDVRRKAIASIGSAFSVAQLALPALRIVTNMRRNRRR